MVQLGKMAEHTSQEKLESDANNPKIIVTVAGVGYKYLADGTPKV
jgi:DNA-binding response OmpR family regulator